MKSTRHSSHRRDTWMAALRRRVWVLRALDELRQGFWFMPLVGTGVGVSACCSLLYLDHLGAFQALPGPSIEQTRALSSMVAGAILSVTATLFSIIMAVLTLASSQFGPRLLHQFLKSGRSQSVLAVFLAVFGYHTTLLAGSELVESARLGFLGGGVAIVLGLGGLVFFIEHFAKNVHADELVSKVGDDFDALVRDLLCSGPELPEGLPDSPPEDLVPIAAGTSGYVQAVDIVGLSSTTVSLDLVVEMAVRPGTHVLEGETLFRVSRALNTEEQDALRRGVWIAGTRSVTQDLEFVLDQLSEMGVRAMSPGINDPFTATRCVHRLTEALSEVARHGDLERRVVDPDGNVRIWLCWPTFRELTAAAFHRLRHASRSDLSVSKAMITACERVAACSDDPKTHRICAERAREIAATTALTEFTERDAKLLQDAVAWAEGHPALQETVAS